MADLPAPLHRDDPDDRAVNPTAAPSFTSILERRLSRRAALMGLAATGAMALWPRSLAAAPSPKVSQAPAAFEEIENKIALTHRVAPGHRADVLIRWGDALYEGEDAFTPHALDAAKQTRQFGYNCDFIGYLPIPRGSKNSEHGLLFVNHEYTSSELMFTKLDLEGAAKSAERVRRAEIEMEAHGGSVLEIRLDADGRWQVLKDSPYTRRITARTPMRVSGPAAGHHLLKTKADPSGRRVLGTFNNCAGGLTPWGTVLMAEENFNLYFHHPRLEEARDRAHLERYGITASRMDWALADQRFDLRHEPNEANRFGWMVEVDPFDPTSTPVKRTALGRIKHEGATVAIAEDGRIVCYMGDDQQFEFLYKFVSHGRFDRNDPAAAKDLLDNGTLFVARFHEDGRLEWLPLVFGSGPLTPQHGFEDQGQVLVETRRAATLLGATPLDRPEDVQPNPRTGKVYLALTNNTSRKESQIDAANPRAKNEHGHVIEITPPTKGWPGGGRPTVDPTALEDRWDILLLAGDPSVPEHGARYHPATTRNGWFSSPDNVAFDRAGRLWVATDQGTKQVAHGTPDGLRAVDLEGEYRGRSRLFFACPVGAEMCGPEFTPDGTTLFASVQHPGEGFHLDGVTPSTFDHPATRWPDFDDAGLTPPRPSVVALRRQDGGPIGG